MLRDYVDRFLVRGVAPAPPAVRVINGETWVLRGDMWVLVPDIDSSPDRSPWSEQEPPPDRPPPFQRMP
jgi:hypothetical protein